MPILNAHKIAKAAAAIRCTSKDAQYFLDMCDEFDLDPHILGRMCINKITKLTFKVLGLRKVRSALMLIIEIKIDNTYDALVQFYSLKEFLTNCVSIDDYEKNQTNF